MTIGQIGCVGHDCLDCHNNRIELEQLKALNAELAGLIKQIIDSRDEHFIDQCVDGMWGWDERANAALAKVEASNGS